ncbi:hypothetical protein CP969_03175 [Streptomyces viridosporus T7A]|uniref:Uncharacterized protein n=1 Tax=Streptomyces viridosporus T7A TaxID=665577 RepID=A0ABX6A9K5_STRVD|nr:hypothetical protein CP969_03175 [Streptomyces viridosporus T7A]
MPVGDEADGEAEEGVVDVVAPFPADARAAGAVRPGDRPLHGPAEDAPARWMPVCGTNRIPHGACRSGTRGLPSTRYGFQGSRLDENRAPGRRYRRH